MVSGREPIIAVLPRAETPTITVYERVFDPEDEAGWAQGDPRVMDTETGTHRWEPDDGNPINWALDVLGRCGTVEPSSSPPFTERTWYSGSGIDFARSGATVDTSAHLSGFTLAEAEQIGTRITTPPTRRRPLPVSPPGLSRYPYDVSRARSGAGMTRGGWLCRNLTTRPHSISVALHRIWSPIVNTSIQPSAEAGTPTDTVTVVLDPRVAYVGFGPDDGPLAQLACRYDAEDVIEDLADAAEKLDFAYLRAWEKAARRIAPDVEWNVSAPYHRRAEDFPLLDAVANTGRGDRDRAALLNQISAAITVEAETLSIGATRWVVIDGGRMAGSATVQHTVMSVPDQHTNDVAALLRDSGELLRAVDSGDLRLELIEASGEVRHDPGALGYVLTDRGTVIFAAADFRPSPLHAVDSDRTVEALAEFLALKPGDTDESYFANYTQQQQFWTAGDGPSKLYELITELPGDTEYNAQIAADAELAAEHSGEIRAWRVRPLERTDLPFTDLLADSPSNARAQYPAYVAAWMADTGRDLDIDTDLFPALGVEPSGAALRHGQPVIPGVRGQQTLDWAVEHVNHWGTEAVIVTDLIPSRVTLSIPATGTATVAVLKASATAHAGAHVEAHHRSRITALPDSDVRIYPGAAVDRREGAHVTLASEARIPARGGAFRDSAMQQRARGR